MIQSIADFLGWKYSDTTNDPEVHKVWEQHNLFCTKIEMKEGKDYGEQVV